SPLSRMTSISSPGLTLGLPSWSSTSARGNMPSDLAPISTPTCVPVSLSTVPLITRSSLTASSASVVKVSSAAAKSSPGAGFSSGAVVECSTSAEEASSAAVAFSAGVGSASDTIMVVESEWWLVVSSNKVIASLLYLALSAGGCGLPGGLLDESFGCGGLTLASELGQSQLSDVNRNPRPKGTLRL